jgi:hypothetical protein
MGFFDTLFGRQKPVPVAKNDRLFAISTATLTLTTEEEMNPGSTAGICFSGVASGPFRQIQQDIEELLKIASSTASAPTTAKSFEDAQGYKWMLFTSNDFQGLVMSIHMVSQSLIDQGYGDRLLSAVFRFNDDSGKPYYFLYNYKRGFYYPFVPRPDSHSRQRNNPDELRLANVMRNDLPIEKDLERWYPMWDLPF